MKQATLKSIAAEMNLSASAVSRIINGKGKEIGLNDHTIESTLAYAGQVGYRPHRQAQNLRLGKTNVIGVILSMPEPNDSTLVYKLFKGISHAAQENEQAMMFFDITDTSSALAAIEQCMNARVDGIIITYRDDPVYLERIRKLINQGVNTVIVLSRGKCSLDCPNVIVDQCQGGFIATDFLIKRGYRRIAHLANRGKLTVGMERFRGYEKALAAAGLPYVEQLVVEDYEGNHYTGAKELLQLQTLPEAVFCWNDKSALYAQRIFSSQGFKLEIVGFDNREFIQYMEKPFNTVDFPLQEVGKLAVTTLLSKSSSTRTLAVTPKMVNYL